MASRTFVIVPSVVVALAVLGGVAAGEEPRYERDVRPILEAHCVKCHGAEARKSGLDLRSVRGMLAGGKGGPALVRGKAEESELYLRVADGTMPPDKVPKLDPNEVAKIRAWIESGAVGEQAEAAIETAALDDPIRPEDRRFWAFRPPSSPAVPAVHEDSRARTPVDRFLLAKLESIGLGFSPDATRATLLRRVTFDLTGLPPTPEEVADYLDDDRPDAYERLVDRLLASPHYGERWGRHWLDAAGYADTVGLDNDAAIIRVREGLWRYRDFVVAAFNRDEPFDRFLREQLAGDEQFDWRSAAAFTPAMRDALVATGFLRTAVDDTTENELNRPLERYQVLHGTIENLTCCVLGLTVACARCHDHKYDPVPQADYYRLMAVLMPSYNVNAWTQAHQRHLADVAPVEKAAIDASNSELDRAIAERKATIATLRRPYEEALLGVKLVALPEPVRGPTREALGVPPEARHAVQRYLAEKYGPRLKVAPDEVDRALGPEDRARLGELQDQIGALSGRKRAYGKLQALWEAGPPPPTHLLKRGNHLTPGREVEPAFLSVLCESPGDTRLEPCPGVVKSSGRRTALAERLTHPGSPAAALVARVFVNRVWQHHFGRGIVATSENLGRMGTPPSHPDLLEWLAADFLSHGWQVKRLHRLILTSTAYRQAAHREGVTTDPDPEAIDPDNVLLWRRPLRRLEAESVRDAMLAVSGSLDRTPGGPPVPLDPRPDGRIEVDLKALPTPTAKDRRSLYLLQRRNYPLSVLGVFDVPLMNTNCPRRVSSVVPLQALAMMNGAFALDQADRFAGRLLREERDAAERRVARAFLLALGRPPVPAELERSLALVASQTARHRSAEPQPAERRAWADLGLVLFNTNEFLYVE
jgi:cytochrome c553